MGKEILLVLGVCLAGFGPEVQAEPRVTYVGQGRYACSGSVQDCEPIDRRNREIFEREQQKRELEKLRREIEQQTELLRRENFRREPEKER